VNKRLSLAHSKCSKQTNKQTKKVVRVMIRTLASGTKPSPKTSMPLSVRPQSRVSVSSPWCHPTQCCPISRLRLQYWRLGVRLDIRKNWPMREMSQCIVTKGGSGSSLMSGKILLGMTGGESAGERKGGVQGPTCSSSSRQPQSLCSSALASVTGPCLSPYPWRMAETAAVGMASGRHQGT
jgi:hypothetical protein